MACKHANIEGNTTKYWVCSLKDKAIDDYTCRNCPLFIHDNTTDDIVNILFGTFGGNYGR